MVLTLSPSTIGSAPLGYLLRWSTPSNQPAKWYGIHATPLPMRSVTSAFIFAFALPSGPVTQTQSAGGQDQRELLDNTFVDGSLLNCEADIGDAELPGVRQRRILGHEIGARREDHLPVHRNRVRQVPCIRARLAVAVGNAAVLDRDTLNAAREIDLPRYGIGIGGVHLLDDRHFLRGEVLVPAEPFQDAERKLGIAVLDFRVPRIGPVGQEADAITFDSEARAERSAAF